MSAEKMFELKDLKKYFPVKRFLGGKPQYVKAVDGITMDIYKGETFGLVGESGCGKSTLGRTMIRMYDVTGGTVSYKGTDITNATPKDMQQFQNKIQIIFQDPYSSLNPFWNVDEILQEPLKQIGMGEGERKDRIEYLLNKVGMKPDDMVKFPYEFSGGQRQRIGIARALTVNPEFIMCDEPIAALDCSIQAQVVNMLEDLQHEMGLTYLFIAHDLAVVRHIADVIGVMYLGNFVEEASKEHLYKNPMHPYTQALLSAVPIPDPTVKKERIILEGNIPSAINPPTGCKFHTRCPKCMEICKREAPKKYQVGDDHFVYCHLYDQENPEVNGAAKKTEDKKAEAQEA